MGKHKRIIIVLIVIFIVLSGLVLAVVRINSHNKNNTGSNKQNLNVLKPIEPIPTLKNYALIQSEVDAKEWEKVVIDAVKYGDDATNGIYQRLSVYAYCVYAATNLKNAAFEVDCRKKAEVLIAQLPTQELRDANTGLFNATAKNEKYIDNSSSQEAGPRG